MAFDKAGLNLWTVGNVKLYSYYTADTLTSATIVAKTSGFCTDNAPGMAAGDVIFLCQATYKQIVPIRITGIDATTCTYTGMTALA